MLIENRVRSSPFISHRYLSTHLYKSISYSIILLFTAHSSHASSSSIVSKTNHTSLETGYINNTLNLRKLDLLSDKIKDEINLNTKYKKYLNTSNQQITGYKLAPRKELTSGSNSNNRFKKADISLPSSKYLEQIGLSVSRVSASSAAPHSLSQLIDQAVNSHPAIKSFNYSNKASSFAVESAKWQYFPTLALDAERVFSASNSPSFQGDNHSITFSITQPLWSGGRIEAGIQRAQAQSKLANSQLEQSKVDLSLQVIQAYGDWLSSHLKSNALQRSLKTHSYLKNLVSKRVKLGLSSSSDKSLASGRLASTRAELDATKAQKTTALTRLSILVRQTLISKNLEKSTTKAIPISSSQAELLALAQQFNYQVQGADAKFATAVANTKQQRAAYKPEVSFRFEHQYGDYNNKHAKPDNRAFIRVQSKFGPGLSMFSDTQQSIALQRAAIENISIQQLASDQQILTDYAVAQSYFSRIKSLNISRISAQNVAASYQRQFLAGQKSWLDVLNSARDLVSQRLLLADAKAANLIVTWRLAILTSGVDNHGINKL